MSDKLEPTNELRYIKIDDNTLVLQQKMRRFTYDENGSGEMCKVYLEEEWVDVPVVAVEDL